MFLRRYRAAAGVVWRVPQVLTEANPELIARRSRNHKRSGIGVWACRRIGEHGDGGEASRFAWG